MADASDMKKLRNFDGSRDCFACGPENQHGLHMDFYSDGDSVHSWLTVERRHCGWRKFLHGGIVSTIMDEAMSWSAHHLLQKLILTKSIHVEFKRPAYIERPLHVSGRIAEINSEREAVMEAVLENGDGDTCATARGVFATMTPKVARRMKMIDESVIHAFEKHFEL
jgi:acyl-coenzyme A thioesterase PaaI-like protein